MTDEERQKQGFAVRRAVLGDAHVDRAEANKTELNADFQNFITRELIFHSALYCGLPAANSAYHMVAEVLAERARTPPE